MELHESFKDAFENNYVILASKIEISDSGLLENLHDKSVITATHKESIMAENTDEKRVTKLLNILTKTNDDNLPKFCEALIAINRQDIVNKYMRKKISTAEEDNDRKIVTGRRQLRQIPQPSQAERVLTGQCSCKQTDSDSSSDSDDEDDEQLRSAKLRKVRSQEEDEIVQQMGSMSSGYEGSRQRLYNDSSSQNDPQVNYIITKKWNEYSTEPKRKGTKWWMFGKKNDEDSLDLQDLSPLLTEISDARESCDLNRLKAAIKTCSNHHKLKNNRDVKDAKALIKDILHKRDKLSKLMAGKKDDKIREYIAKIRRRDLAEYLIDEVRDAENFVRCIELAPVGRAIAVLDGYHDTPHKSVVGLVQACLLLVGEKSSKMKSWKATKQLMKNSTVFAEMVRFNPDDVKYNNAVEAKKIVDSIDASCADNINPIYGVYDWTVRRLEELQPDDAV